MFIRRIVQSLNLMNTQWKSKEDIEKIQEKKLHEIIKYSYENVPFYRKIFDKNKINPNDIKKIKDLDKIPIITKNDFIEQPKKFISKEADLDNCIIRRTSGSTSQPFEIIEDEEIVDHTYAHQSRKLLSYGYKPWDKIFRLTQDPYNKKIPEWAKQGQQGLLNKLGLFKVETLLMSNDIEKNIRKIFSEKPKILISFPSYFKILGKKIIENGTSPNFLKMIITQSEILDNTTRKFIEKTFNCPVYNGYGAMEIGAVGGIAWECPSREGLHVNSDMIILETLKNNEVVITCLFRKVMPIIRYKIGDVVTPINKKCKCGRGLKLIENVKGRTLDFLTMPNGKLIAPYTIIVALENIKGMSNFQIIQEKKNLIIIKVENLKISKELIKDACKKIFHKNVKINVNSVKKLDIKMGKKFRAVISKVR